MCAFFVLGVSSILAAAIVSACARSMGREYTAQSLIHMVLLVEQKLTTGGGWQDQVGGVLPGFKITHSLPKIPLEVVPQVLPVPPAVLSQFNAHLLLLYTGSSRLARNLLQTVIRRWYHRSKDISELVDGLCQNAHDMQDAIVQGDMSEVGRRLDIYWRQKKMMATDAEPRHVTHLINKLKPHVFGLSLCGAGGGGFLVLLTKEPNCIDQITQILRDDLKPTGQCTLHRCSVCPAGLDVTVDSESGGAPSS